MFGFPVIERGHPLGKAPELRSRLAADPRFDGFDSTEIQTFGSGALPSGATTLYSCPTGKRARLRGRLILLHNPTAAGITMDVHHVPSGASAGSSNKLVTGTINVDQTTTLLINTEIGQVMHGGDALVINTGAAGLNVWGVALEERSRHCAWSSGFRGNLGTSELEVFRVPALRTCALSNLLVFNPTGSSITLTVWAKAAGAAAADSNELVRQAVAANAVARVELALMPTLEQDGVVSALGSAAGLNVWVTALLL